MSNTYKYIRNELEDTYGILKLQDKILEIMVYIDRFCREHNITYFLMGGSALGAIRHKGFIPWDDDLDIFMPYEDYERFAKLCETDLDKKRFYFQRENTTELPNFFSKIRMNGTTCIDEVLVRRKGMHQGIFVDIMCLHHAAPEGWRRKLQFYEAALLRASALSKLDDYKATNIKKKLAIGFARYFVRGSIKKFLIKDVKKYNNQHSDFVAHVFGRAKFKNAYYPAELFEVKRYVPFEKTELAVPNGVEKYLTLRYGSNYMEMPNEETKAIYQTHAMIWDTEKDYKEYIK